MKSKKPLRIILFLLPLIAGSVIAFILKGTYRLVPVVQLRIDIASMAVLLGAIFSFSFIRMHNKNTRQQKELERLRIHEHNEHKQFLLRLDHEIKNPLSAIKTGMASLKLLTGSAEPGKNQTEIDKTIAQTDSQIERINHLVSDLRKLAELETYKVEYQPVNIHELLKQMTANISDNPGMEDRNVILSLPSAPWHLPEIMTDEDLLYLALSNLLDNAIKYTRSNDTIEIRAHENRDHISIEVADSGIGIPEDEIQNVWGKLYRGKNSRGIPGVGLGLSIVETIIKRLEGQCDIRSREGEGTVFILQIPKSFSK